MTSTKKTDIKQIEKKKPLINLLLHNTARTNKNNHGFSPSASQCIDTLSKRITEKPKMSRANRTAGLVQG
jgi:hypothetical protein